MSTRRGKHQGSISSSDSTLGAWSRKFLVRLILAYCVLLAAWLVVGPTFRAGMVATANGCLRAIGMSDTVRFMEFTDWKSVGTESNADVAVLAHPAGWKDAERRDRHLLAKRIVTFSQPYVAFTFLVSLAVATPLPWRSKLGRLLISLCSLTVLMWLCVAVDVLHTLVSDGVGLEVPRSVGETLAVMNATVTDWPAGVLIVPFVLWLIACLSRRCGHISSRIDCPHAQTTRSVGYRVLVTRR